MSTRGKFVVLKLDGDLEQQGFRVTLEIAPEGDRPLLELLASLPIEPELVCLLQQWQQSFRSLGTANRILPLEIIYGGSVNRREDCQRLAGELRDRFNAWLDAAAFRPIDRRLREHLSPGDSIRLLIRTQDRHLRRLPWHLWHLMEQYPHAEIALGSLTVERVITAKTTPSTGKVKILTILGDRTGIQVEHDRQVLEQLPNADVTFLVEPQRQQINQQLWEQSWDILFFAGHSQTEGTQGRIYLNSQESLTLEELKYGLRWAIAQGLQLAIFNSCDGLGLAEELESLHLPQLIVMREPVPDPVAQAFLQYFLRAFVQGESLYGSARQAREQLQGLEGEIPCASWLPVIVQNSVELPPSWQELLRSDEPPAINPAQPDREAIAAIPTKKPLPANPHWLRLRIGFFTSVAVTFLIMGLRGLGVLQSLELTAYDRMMQLQAGSNLDPHLLIVTVNDRDVQQFGKPLSDRTVHQLLTKLEQFQPRVIGLDIYRDFPQKEGWNDLVKYLQTSDRVVALCQVGEVNGLPNYAPPPGVPKDRLGFSDSLVPDLDLDSAVRRYVLAMDVGESSCKTPFSFSFQVVRRFLNQDVRYEYQPGENLVITQMPSASTVIKTVQPNWGGYHLSLDQTLGWQILISYRSAQVAQQVSLTEILTGQDADLQRWIKDRIVLIGYVGENTQDYHPTPLGEMPGVMVHAHVVQQLLATLLEGQPLMSTWSQAGDTLWVWSWAVIGGVIAGWIYARGIRGAIVTMAIVTLGGSCFILFTQSIWVPLVPSVFALVVTTGTVAYILQKNLLQKNL